MNMEVTIYLFFIIFLFGYEGASGQCVKNTADVNTNHPNDTSTHNEFEPVLNGTESEKLCPQSGGGKLIITLHDNNGENIAVNNLTGTGFTTRFNESVGVDCTHGTDVCPDYTLHFECECPTVTETSVMPAHTTSLHTATTSRQSSATSRHSAKPHHSTVRHSVRTGSTPSRQTSTPIKPTAHATGASGIGNGGSGAATVRQGHLIHHVTVLLIVITRIRL